MSYQTLRTRIIILEPYTDEEQPWNDVRIQGMNRIWPVDCLSKRPFPPPSARRSIHHDQ